MPEDPSLLASELDRLYKQLYRFERRGFWWGLVRRPIAYGLKGITLFMVLAIASGKFKDNNTDLGIVASVALTLETLFSNLKRLIGEVAAGYAAKDQALDVSTEFNREKGVLQGKIELRTISEEDARKQELTLQEAAAKKLGAVVKEIQKGLHDLDLETLRNLAIQSKDKIN